MEKYKNKEWLSEKWEQGSVPDISGECGVNDSVIYYWLGKHNIIDRFTDKSKRYNRKEWLQEMYYENDMSREEIADICGVSKNTIYQRLSYFDIISESENFIRRSISAGVPEDSKHLDPSWMQERYIDDGMTIREIANMDEVKASQSSVNRALSAFSIEKRPSLSVSGEDNPLYKDGESSRRYSGSWQSTARSIRKRDNYKCQSCGIDNKTHKKRYGFSLDVHHITPRREFNNSTEANKNKNLITLCRGCHSEVESGDRDCPEL